jgi:hypothetical protein
LQGLKNISELYKIRRKLNRKNPMWVISAICTAVFLGVMYSIAPAYICSSLLITSVFQYFLCAYISMSLHDRENDVFEEVLLLHCDNDIAYYVSREMLSLGGCVIFSLVLSVFPLIKSFVEPHFFTRAFTPADVVIGSGLIFLSGVCGIETADLFHPRNISRKPGICALVLISVIAVCKPALIQTLPVFNILNILVPPIMDSLILLGNSDRFIISGDCLILLHMLIYALAVMLIKIKLLKFRKYRM